MPQNGQHTTSLISLRPEGPQGPDDQKDQIGPDVSIARPALTAGRLPVVAGCDTVAMLRNNQAHQPTLATAKQEQRRLCRHASQRERLPRRCRQIQSPNLSMPAQ